MADLDPVVQAALAVTRQGRLEHRSRRKAYDKAYDVYRAKSPERKVGEWRSKLRPKYALQIIDAGLVNIVSGAPRVLVSPRRPEYEMGAKAMQLVLDYYIAEDHVVERQPVFVQSALVFGVAVAKNHWLYREESRNKRQTRQPHPFDESLPGYDVVQERQVTHDRPTFEPWDIYRTYWDPAASDVDSCSYVVLQSYMSASELRQLAFNPDTGAGIYHNVEDLIASGTRKPTHSSAQQRLLGISDQRFKDRFLVEEIWTDEAVVVVGNEQVLLRNQPNPYWHKRKPIVITQTRPDLFEMLGIPETELVADIQDAMHTLQNMTIDNLHLTVQRGITYREGGVLDPDSLVLEPRFKWAVSDHDDVRPFEVQPLSADVYNERGRLLADMQLVTGINPYVSGSDLGTVDQNTATGITALQEVASRLLRFKAAQINYKGYQRTYEMWGAMIQQFFPETPLSVKLLGPGGSEDWIEVSAEDVQGELLYKLEGTEESLSKQQERGEAVALLNAFAPLVPTGLVNIKPLLEKIAVAYDFPNPDALFSSPQQPAIPAAPMPGGVPQAQGLVNQAAMPPQVQQAILSGRG